MSASFTRNLEYKFQPFDEYFIFNTQRPVFRIYARATSSSSSSNTGSNIGSNSRSDNSDNNNINSDCSSYKEYVLSPENMMLDRFEQENDITKLTYAATNDCFKVKTVVTLKRAEKEVIGTINVQTDGCCLIERVQFPNVQWHQVYHYDNLLMSSPWGDNIPRPAKTIQEFCTLNDSYWVHDYIKRGNNEVIYSYPSIMAMQYMVLHNKARSVYMGCYSTADSTMTFNAKALSKTALELSVNHYPFLEKGTWKSPDCGMAVLGGGWHSAADLYAEHMGNKFKDPDVPAWMKDESEGWHGWAEIMMRLEGRKPKYRYKDLPEMFRKIKETGINTFQIAGWTYDGFDTYYPDFNTDPALGTKDELRGALDEIKAMGGHTILYTNGRLVDPRSEFYKNGGDKAVCLGEDGKPYVEKYSTSSEFRIACPSCDEYGDWMAGRTGRIFTEFGANAIQVDQISCNYAYFCYDKSHSHPTPSTNYLLGIENELKKIRQNHKSIDPDIFVWCEGCHERFGQFYDVEQGHGEEFTWQIGESVPEQFHYTYPNRISTGMSSNIGQLCHSYIQGKPFDVQYASIAEDESFTSLLKNLVSMRRKYPSYFLKGHFIHTKGLEVTQGARAYGIENSHGKALMVNLWMEGASSGQWCSAVLKNPRPGLKCRLVYPELIEANLKGDWLEIKWRGPVATLVFDE